MSAAHTVGTVVLCKVSFSFPFSVYRFLSFGVRPSGSKVVNCSSSAFVKFPAMA